MPSGANEFGGGNTYSRGLLKGIINNNDILCIYVTRKKYYNIPEQEKISENCFIERLKLGDSVDDKDTLQNYTGEALDKIREIIEKYHLSNFIIHSSYWHSGVVALELSKEYNTHYIHTIQSNGKKKKLVNSKQLNLDKRVSAEQLIFENAKYLICSSIAEQNEIHNLYNIDYDKLILTGLPIAQEFTSPSHDKYGNISTYNISDFTAKSYLPLGYSVDYLETWWASGPFLYYGRLHVDKGILEIIKAWSMLFKKYRSQTPPLWIAGGTTKQIAQIRKKLFDMDIHIDKFENQHKIIWWGTLSPSELSCLLIKCMVLVTHSKYESGGLMVIEALASSTAVIATPFGYAKDCICDWYNGFVVDYGDIPLLELRMSHFVENPYLSDLLSKNAKHTYDKIASSFDFLKIHFDLYNDFKPQDYKISINAEIESNGILGYQNIPNKEIVAAHIKSFCKSYNYTVIKTYMSSDSIVVIIEFKDKEYRIDIWLTTLNTRRFLDNSEPYIITSTDKIKSVVKLHNNKTFQSLDYFSVEDKLSIVSQTNINEFINIKQAVKLMNEAFLIKNEVPSNSALSEKTTSLFFTFSRYSTYIKDKTIVNQIEELLKALEQYNNKRIKLHYGFTPCLNSTDKIYNGKLYGIFEYLYSEYGHNIAMVFFIMRIFPNKEKLMDFDYDQSKSIISWYVYLSLEHMMLDFIRYPNELPSDSIKKLIDLLE